MASWLERLNDLGFDSYDAYLRSPHWQRKRKQVGDAANWTCACGAPSTQTHHRTYARLGRERLKDLHAVCDACHERIHDYVKQGSDLESSTMAVVEGPDFWHRPKRSKKEKRKAQRARQSAKRAARRAAAMAEAEHKRAERQATVRSTALDVTARRLESIGMRDRPIKPKPKKKQPRRTYGELSIRTTATSSPAGAPGSIPGSSSSSTA